MIASVSGVVAAVAPDGAVLEVGGVGLSVQCSPATLATLHIGSNARLATSLVVREDSLTLYGFVSEEERSIFELLQTASGVGPRLAQAVLAVHSPGEIRRAIAAHDVVALTRVPGVGKKGAERLILELKDRIGIDESLQGEAVPGKMSPISRWREQVSEGLVSLGWSQREAELAIAELAASYPAGEIPSTADALKQAIALLGRAR